MFGKKGIKNSANEEIFQEIQSVFRARLSVERKTGFQEQ